MANNIFTLVKVTPSTIPHGPYYVIESFPYPQFVMDEEGMIKSFDEFDEASTEAADCQQGFVICF